MSVRVVAGDMLACLPILAAEGVRAHACVTDPPYHFNALTKRYGAADAKPPRAGEDGNGASGVFKRSARGFMGKQWDGGAIAFDPATWAAIGACLLPGAHLVAFAGTKGWHRMACAIEDAGFEIRDTLLWIYGSGFPKSHNIGKAIDRAAGATREVIGPGRRHDSKRSAVAHGDTERLAGGVPDITAPATDAARQWDGWGTALKPAFEPIVLARWPLAGKSVAANVLDHGCGALNIDACRVDAEMRDMPSSGEYVGLGDTRGFAIRARPTRPTDLGRFPANVLHDGSAEVVNLFPDTGPGQIGGNNDPNGSLGYHGGARGLSLPGLFDSGSAARFFYSSKADPVDRMFSRHPTVKPVDLMRWLVRLVTPRGGLVLDPFAGTGTTGQAALAEGARAILIEREAEYLADIARRIAHVTAADTPLLGGTAP